MYITTYERQSFRAQLLIISARPFILLDLGEVWVILDGQLTVNSKPSELKDSNAVSSYPNRFML